MKEYSPDIKFVGFGSEPEYARYLWQAALEELDAHMVHYGESSFATVFANKIPAPRVNDERVTFLRRAVGTLIGKRPVEAEEYVLSDNSKSQFSDLVTRRAGERSIDTAGAVFYLDMMRTEDARRFAESRQLIMEDRIEQDT